MINYLLVRRIGYNTIEFMSDKIRLEFVQVAEFGKLGNPIVPKGVWLFTSKQEVSDLCRALNTVTKTLWNISSLDVPEYRVFDLYVSE